MEIRRQLVLAISVVFLLSVALFGFVAVPPLDRFMVEQTNRLMLSEATRASDRIDHWLASRGNLLRMLATELELSQLAPDDPAFKALLDQTATRFGDKFSYLYCGFENQLHVTTRKTALPLGFDPTTRPWYIAAQAKRDVTFTEPYADIQNGQFSFSIAYPVNMPVRGVLGTDVYLSDLSRLASEAFIHPEAAVVLISQAGQVLFASQPDLATPGEHIASIQQGALQAILTQRSPDGYASGQFFFEGQPRHLLAVPVTASGWQVLVYLPQALSNGKSSA